MNKLIISGFLAVGFVLYYSTMDDSAKKTDLPGKTIVKKEQTSSAKNVKIVHLDQALSNKTWSSKNTVSNKQIGNAFAKPAKTVSSEQLSELYKNDIAKAKYIQQQQRQSQRLVRDAYVKQKYQKMVQARAQRETQRQRYQKQLAFNSINRAKMQQQRLGEDIRKIKRLNEQNLLRTINKSNPNNKS